jgi:hypothetical protein
VHFLRNALDYVPRKVDDDCLGELRWLYDRRDLAEARRDPAAWLAKWQATYPKLCAWVEEHMEETLSFYRLPRQHHKHLKSTDEIDKSFVLDGGMVVWHGRPRGEQRGGAASSAGLPYLDAWPQCGARAPVGCFPGRDHGRGRRAERPSTSLARRATG